MSGSTITVPNAFSQAASKMTIHAFADKDYNTELDQFLFVVPINPETFTRNYKIDLDKRTGHGQPGTQPGYKASAPEELKIDFVLDGTGTMQGYPSKYANMSVHDQLQAFLNSVYKFNDDTHRPNFVTVIWGTEINFKGTVSNVELNHTLFLPDGSPLRVKVSATFVQSESDKARAKKGKSPDLTKKQLVQQGDRLDWLTFKKYNDPGYFLQVGRVNNLVTVRKIAPPQELYFPPFSQNAT